jgi:hypothetical protein
MTGSGKGRRSTWLMRVYTTLVALVCTVSVAYAIHADGEAARGDRAALRAQQWERDARATRVHRTRTIRSTNQMIRQYNALARGATRDQRRLLAALAKARRRAATEKPTGAAPVEYATQSIVTSQPAVQPALPASAAPVAAAPPMTTTS